MLVHPSVFWSYRDAKQSSNYIVEHKLSQLEPNFRAGSKLKSPAHRVYHISRIFGERLIWQFCLKLGSIKFKFGGTVWYRHRYKHMHARYISEFLIWHFNYNCQIAKFKSFSRQASERVYSEISEQQTHWGSNDVHCWEVWRKLLWRPCPSKQGVAYL